MINFISLNRKEIFVGFVVAIILAIASITFVFAQSATAETSARAKVEFNHPVSLSEFATLVKQNGIIPTELHYTQGEIQGGYTVELGKSIDEALEDFAEKHETFLALAISKTEQQIREEKDETIRQRALASLEQLRNAKIKNDNDGLKIDAIETNDKQSLKALEQTDLIKQIVPLQKISHKIGARVTKALDSAKRALIDVVYAGESWAPYGGGSDVQYTYTYQTFYFDYIGDYDSDDTYEHETQVYDNDFADYDNYWSSNMPNAYKDTQFLDDIDNFTVGTFTASSLSTYYQYYTYMALEHETANSATVRIKGQKGHRYPSWCYSTWCVFADATTGSMAVFTAPAGMSWQY
ncbi:MAG: hypothetical protein ACKKL4_02350 [Patescibacteria group bacterium]